MSTTFYHSSWLPDLIGSGKLYVSLHTSEPLRGGELGEVDTGYHFTESESFYTRTPLWNPKAKARVEAQQRARSILGPKRGRWS